MKNKTKKIMTDIVRGLLIATQSSSVDVIGRGIVTLICLMSFYYVATVTMTKIDMTMRIAVSVMLVLWTMQPMLAEAEKTINDKETEEALKEAITIKKGD